MIPMDEVAFPSVFCRAHGVMGVAKPAGVHVFGDESLASWLVERYPHMATVGPADEPAFVHRLDRGTSGIMLAAEEQRSYDQLRRLFSSSGVKKSYLALVEGKVGNTLSIDKPLGGRYRRSARVWVDDGIRRLRGVKPAKTRVEPLACCGGFCLCRVMITTGTRHQIRAHLSYLGHPVVGDQLYGAEKVLAEIDHGFFLHAHRLEFVAPKTAETLSWTCPPDRNFINMLAIVGIDAQAITP